jgi:myosin heavy subunit
LVKAELSSLHGVTTYSTKLLTEKLTLARELSSLKPELDHLRSQTTLHQSLLAEKLSLQRQLSTIQVELETEKRSSQRALAKEGKLQVEDARFESQLESLQADLAKERRERQRVEREAQKASTESENRVTTLASRLDAFRNKLKSTKEQLKETQASLQKAEASTNAMASRASTSQAPSWALSQRKRPAVQMDADTMIGTPGDLPAAKRGRKASTLPGEKSTFSITPFLNRTASVAPESPPLDKASKDGKDDVDLPDSPIATSKTKTAPARAASETANTPEETEPPPQSKKPSALENAKDGKANSRRALGRKPKAAPTLELVTEEDNDRNSGSNAIMPERANSKSVADDTINEGAEMKKKKRKLLGGGLGKTLFDEDDGDALKGERGIMGGVRGFGTLAKGSLGAPKFGPRKALGGGMSTFGAISPLKKDRKAT